MYLATYYSSLYWHRSELSCKKPSNAASPATCSIINAMFCGAALNKPSTALGNVFFIMIFVYSVRDIDFIHDVSHVHSYTQEGRDSFLYLESQAKTYSIVRPFPIIMHRTRSGL